MSQVVKGHDGFLHFALEGKSYRVHPSSVNIEVSVPSGRIWEPPHWAPAAVRWPDLPYPIQRALLAKV